MLSGRYQAAILYNAEIGRLGSFLPFAAIPANFRFAQLVYFAKSRERLIAACHFHLKMLRCGPSKRPLVHGAAFW